MSRQKESAPKNGTALMMVTDGQVFVGTLLRRGRSGVETYDSDGKSLGLFPDVQSAARAIPRIDGGAQ